ncbi:MAG: hypothetical protein WBA36_18885 [Mesorhizobium sp.]
MPNPVQAAAEGLPKITRRAALAVAGAGLTTALTGVDVSVATPAPEHPWDKARRLAGELSEVLAEGNGGFDGPSGKWSAQVYPSGHSDYPVGFMNISSHEWPRHNVTLPCKKVIDAHRKARKAFEAACDGTDRKLLGREPSKAAVRRWNKASKAEEQALVDVCAFVPRGPADAKAKAKYLKTFIDWGELYERHILALAFAGVRS